MPILTLFPPHLVVTNIYRVPICPVTVYCSETARESLLVQGCSVTVLVILTHALWHRYALGHLWVLYSPLLWDMGMLWDIYEFTQPLRDGILRDFPPALWLGNALRHFMEIELVSREYNNFTSERKHISMSILSFQINIKFNKVKYIVCVVQPYNLLAWDFDFMFQDGS